MWKGELLDPIVNNKEAIVGDVNVGRVLVTANPGPGFKNPVRREWDSD